MNIYEIIIKGKLIVNQRIMPGYIMPRDRSAVWFYDNESMLLYVKAENEQVAIEHARQLSFLP